MIQDKALTGKRKGIVQLGAALSLVYKIYGLVNM